MRAVVVEEGGRRVKENDGRGGWEEEKKCSFCATM